MTAPADGGGVGQAKTARHDSGRSKVPAIMAGVLWNRPSRSRACGRMKL
jgi:hypothetical protein